MSDILYCWQDCWRVIQHVLQPLSLTNAAHRVKLYKLQTMLYRRNSQSTQQYHPSKSNKPTVRNEFVNTSIINLQDHHSFSVFTCRLFRFFHARRPPQAQNVGAFPSRFGTLVNEFHMFQPCKPRNYFAYYIYMAYPHDILIQD
jgi:hypothetical protein